MNLIHKSPLLKAKSGKSIKVTHEGSLGLLALGDIGIQLWRQEKLAHHKNHTSTKTTITSIPKTAKS